MKTLGKFLLLMAVFSIIAACNKTDELGFSEELTDMSLKKAQVMVTVPFKANFTVWNHSDYTDRSCGDIPIFRLTMIGEGVATHLGKLTTTMTFCCNTATGEYWDTDIVFIAANLDKLYASIPIGQIVPNDEENSNRYSTKFIDEMYFTGGTGRFEGASGMAMSNAYVHRPTDEYIHKGDEVWHTDFFSEGTLTLIKGK